MESASPFNTGRFRYLNRNYVENEEPNETHRHSDTYDKHNFFSSSNCDLDTLADNVTGFVHMKACVCELELPLIFFLLLLIHNLCVFFGFLQYNVHRPTTIRRNLNDDYLVFFFEGTDAFRDIARDRDRKIEKRRSEYVHSD